MSMRHKKYKYLPGGTLSYPIGSQFNNNIRTDTQGSNMFTVKMGFRIHNTTDKILLASNWPSTTTGWEVGVNKGIIYYTETSGGSSVTTSFQTIQSGIWYDLKFQASREDGPSNLYCSIDGGITYTIIQADRQRSVNTGTSRNLLFGDSNHTVDLRGLVGCIGCYTREGVSNTCEWDIENALTNGGGNITGTSTGSSVKTAYAWPAALYGYEEVNK